MASQNKDTLRVAAGLKATVHNPKVSDEAKASANERLHQMGTSVEEPASKAHKTDADVGGYDEGYGEENLKELEDDVQRYNQQQLGGFKTTLKNSNASEEKKQHAKQVLEEYGQAPGQTD
ncbi:hypothetical protein C0992_000939 [Termitomyces sp. T32_za158]|nr:hypothetical protein C0992_000939 [Termitomyces sp. T32_za158]